MQSLGAARRSVASEVRSAFLDLQQADRVLESETKNVQTADESLEMAKGNFAAGLGTQLDVLQAASDVTRTRTTRLSAIYLHNVALAAWHTLVRVQLKHSISAHKLQRPRVKSPMQRRFRMWRDRRKN